MRQMFKDLKLKKELRGAGSDDAEARDLLKTAAKIRGAARPKPASRSKDQIYASITGKQVSGWHLPIIRHALAYSMAIIILSGGTVAYAQTTLPGNPLYTVKRATEDVRLWIQPSYAKHIAQERQKELDELKKRGESSDRIQKAEDDLKNAEDRVQQQSGDSGTEDQSGSGTSSGGDSRTSGDDSPHSGSGSSSGSSGDSGSDSTSGSGGHDDGSGSGDSGNNGSSDGGDSGSH